MSIRNLTDGSIHDVDDVDRSITVYFGFIGPNPLPVQLNFRRVGKQVSLNISAISTTSQGPGASVGAEFNFPSGFVPQNVNNNVIVKNSLNYTSSGDSGGTRVLLFLPVYHGMEMLQHYYIEE